jgi:large repetitive protein
MSPKCVTTLPVYATAFPIDATLQGKLFAGTAKESDFASFVTANESAARASTMVYDAAGRMLYTLTRSDTTSQVAVVSERRYDALGQVQADVSYGVTIAYSAGSSAANVTTACRESARHSLCV